MPCLIKYKWVKIPRDIMPESRGILLDYVRAYSAAAISKGTMRYCQYENEVEEGMWAGGKVGLRSILKAKTTGDAFERLKRLADAGILTYEYSVETKFLSYKINEEYRVRNCKPELPVRCKNTYGFVRVPRGVSDKLAARKYVFEEADAWIDLWCHTVSGDNRNILSFFQPCIQMDGKEPVLTLETLGQRWGWSKTKVRRFFVKNAGVFRLHKLPGSYGCIIFNPGYDDIRGENEPSDEQILKVCRKLQKYGKNKRSVMTDRAFFCVLVNRHTRKLIAFYASKNRGALSFIIRYTSLMNNRNYVLSSDCGVTVISKDKRRSEQEGKIKYIWVIGEERRIVTFYGPALIDTNDCDWIPAERIPEWDRDSCGI